MHVPEPKKTPSGWRIQLRIGGQSIPVTADTPKECKRQAALIKAEAQAAAKPVKKCSLTLSQAIDAYIAERCNILSPSTLRGYRIIQKHRFSSTMNRPLFKISPSEWRSILNDELSIASRKTVKNGWGLVKSVLTAHGISVDDGILVSNPRKRRDANWLEPDEIKKFVAAAADDPLCVPMLLALMSMRISEIDALRWENIPPHSEFISTSGARVLDENNEYVLKAEQKNLESDRTVPLLIPELRAAIRRDWKPEGKVLPCSQATLRNAVSRTCDRAGVRRVTVHQLRHSFASLSAHLRIPAEISMEIGGWSNDKIMKEIYTHIARSDIERYKNEMWKFYNSSE
jgi:integrase|nr:MAG TPA: Integrase [Caudoviricetes sp.]